MTSMLKSQELPDLIDKRKYKLSIKPIYLKTKVLVRGYLGTSVKEVTQDLKSQRLLFILRLN